MGVVMFFFTFLPSKINKQKTYEAAYSPGLPTMTANKPIKLGSTSKRYPKGPKPLKQTVLTFVA